VLADRAHACNLSEGVHTGVRSARAHDSDRPVLERAKRLFKKSLDRDALGLALPADVVRAVVLDCEL
jgi:hypothetical protein